MTRGAISCRSVAERRATRPVHAWTLRRSEFRARHPPRPVRASTKMRRRSGSVVPSPQRNVNEIRGVRNTNHAPATIVAKTQQIEFSESRHKLPTATRYQIAAFNVREAFASCLPVSGIRLRTTLGSHRLEITVQQAFSLLVQPTGHELLIGRPSSQVAANSPAPSHPVLTWS